MILGIIVVEDVFLAFYLALLQPILGEQEGAAEIVSSIAIAFAFLLACSPWRAGAGAARPPDHLRRRRRADHHPARRLRRLRRRASPTRVGASDAVGALLAGMVVAGTGIGPQRRAAGRPAARHVRGDLLLLVRADDRAERAWARSRCRSRSRSSSRCSSTSSPASSPRGSTATGRAAAANTALMLVSRGEFELILASLAVAAGLDSRVAPFAALYVLVALDPLAAAVGERPARACAGVAAPPGCWCRRHENPESPRRACRVSAFSYSFTSADGNRLAVVLHNEGTCEIYVFARPADDEPSAVVELDDDETRQLGAILGGSYRATHDRRGPRAGARRARDRVDPRPARPAPRSGSHSPSVPSAPAPGSRSSRSCASPRRSQARSPATSSRPATRWWRSAGAASFRRSGRC